MVAVSKEHNGGCSQVSATVFVLYFVDCLLNLAIYTLMLDRGISIAGDAIGVLGMVAPWVFPRMSRGASKNIFGCGLALLCVSAIVMWWPEPKNPVETPITVMNRQGIVTQGQSGGQNTVINEAPSPKLTVGPSDAHWNPDGTVTETTTIEVVSPYPPGQLYIQANAPKIISFGVVPQRIGGSSTGPTGTRDDYAFTTLMQPFGRYVLSVVLPKPTHVELAYEFE